MPFFSSLRRIHRRLKPLREGLKVVACVTAVAVAMPVATVAAVTVPLVIAAERFSKLKRRSLS